MKCFLDFKDWIFKWVILMFDWLVYWLIVMFDLFFLCFLLNWIFWYFCEFGLGCGWIFLLRMSCKVEGLKLEVLFDE